MNKAVKKITEINIEQHPQWYFDIPNMKVLILGSFPPHFSKWSYSFYYPNKQNNFWKIIAAINKTELNYFTGEAAVDERKQLMCKLQIGIQNMGKVIGRKGTSARDTDIEIIQFQDILSIIKLHPELNKIILSGFSAENSTYYAFIKYLKEHNIKLIEPYKVASGNSFEIRFDTRVIKCEIVNSTSTAARIKLDDLIRQFKNAIDM